MSTPARARHAVTAEPSLPGRRRGMRLAVQGIVLVLVVGGTSAFALLHKTVTLDVDGRAVAVEAYGRTVGDVLAGADVEVADGDVVAPGLDQPITDGAEIVVRHGRDVEIEIDGQLRTVWSTALNVGEAVAELGLRDGEALVSASRSAPLAGRTLRVSTPKTIHLMVDGTIIAGTSNASTVRDALRDVGLVLNPGDRVSVPLDATAVDGLAVMVTRAASTGETVTEALPFESEKVEDPDLDKGETVVRTEGRAGQRTTTYALTTVGGAEVERTPVASVVTIEPVTQVVAIGTREPEPEPAVPPVSVAVSPGSAQALGKEMAAARGWGDDQFACLLALWNKESGWRVTAANSSSGAYGIPQALPGSKMASAGADWRTNAATQISWGLGYISGRYGTPCGAWAHAQSRGWY